ncbi:MAG: nucleoside-diphosphate sugar epimerase/dehydratase, partial [Anaerolineae bacterium]
KPGITSPASVMYRNEEQLLGSKNVVDEYISAILPSKLRLDLLYVSQRTILTDWDVLFWTAIILLPKLKRTEVPETLLFWGPLTRFFRRYFSWFAIDLIVALGAVSTAGLLWRADRPLDVGLFTMAGVGAGIALLFSLVNSALGLGRVYWSKADPGRILDLFLSASLTTIFLLLVNQAATPIRLPVGLIVFSALLAYLGFVTARYRSRILTGIATRWTQVRGLQIMGERVLIVGAGGGGELAHWLLQKGKFAQAFCIVGMVDDALVKRGAEIAGCSVLGSLDEIPELVAGYDIGLIIFAIENIDEAVRQRVQSLCQETAARLVVLPDILQQFHCQAATDEKETTANGRSPGAYHHRQQILNRLKEIDPLVEQRAWPAVQQKLSDLQRALEYPE